MRFFNEHDDTRTLLESVPVLMSTAVSRGGAKLLKALSRVLGTLGLYEKSITYLRGVCDRLVEPATNKAARPMPAVAVTAPTRAALSPLPAFTDEEDSVVGAERESSKAAMAKGHLEECLDEVTVSKAKDPLDFWQVTRTATRLSTS